MSRERGNFVADFVHHAGVSEVPKRFVRWTALSVRASALADRVWMHKGAAKVKPNLYVFLLGPSGCGKGEAIDFGLRLLKDVPQVYMEYGRTTAAALVDRLAVKTGTPTALSKLYLVTPELAMAVGRGTVSDDLIKLTTEMYKGSPVPLTERTRTAGRHMLKDYCLNWIAGTTREWMRDCVSREAVEGGFFARVACIQAQYAGHRVINPQLPIDYDETAERMREHLRYVMGIEWPMRFDHRAQEIHDTWYLTRPEPHDESLLPSWRREDDFVRKVAMLLAMAEPDPHPTINAMHVTEAQQMVADANRGLPAVIDYIGAGVNPDSDTMRRVRQVIKEAGVIQQATLTMRMAQVGVTSDKLRLCVDTLIEGGAVRRVRGARGFIYTWSTRPNLRLVMDEEG